MKRCWNCGGARKELFEFRMSLYGQTLSQIRKYGAVHPIKRKSMDNICKSCANKLLTMENKPSEAYKEAMEK